jgi:Bacterial mobilisation protein (MobC)/Ribbon-helix-helix protein, copG family
MSGNKHLKAWVSRETKERFTELARRQGVSESALLKRVIEALIGGSEVRNGTMAPVELVPASGRLSVRLAVDDLLVLRERARSRGMPSATYVSLLVRSHLRNLSPIPDNELKALQQAIGQVSAIGRNLNQIARAVNAGERPDGPRKADLHAILRACTGLRDAFKGVIERNIQSWRVS